VVGTSGAGKTTLSFRLAELLGCPHIELDAFQHGPHWQQATVEEPRDRTDRATAGDCWVCDGNYEAVRDLVWGRATQLVWLDYERPLIMARVIRRSVWRAITRKPMWNENREDWRSWADPEHPIRWAWAKHGERRRKYPELLRQPAYAHLDVLRLRHPRETRRLLGAGRRAAKPADRISRRAAGSARSPCPGRGARPPARDRRRRPGSTA
jgi:adenylate kinase family enzyme